MRYLHTMFRVQNLDDNIAFFNLLGFVEIKRKEVPEGKFTLVFLATSDDAERAKKEKSPMIELTYNWPDQNGKTESYSNGGLFGHLAYRVDNIYDVCQHLMDHGVVINRPPRDGHMAFVKSPEGISVELLQEGEHLAPQEPWVSMPNVGEW